MPLIVIDGASQSGKSVLIRRLQEIWPGSTLVRHFPKILPNDQVAAALRGDIDILRRDEKALIVWENSWLATQVSATSGQYSPKEAGSPFLAEWKFGRAVQTIGERILMNPVIDGAYFRDREKKIYKGFASSYGWTIIDNDECSDLYEEADKIVRRLLSLPFRYWPPLYCGPADAPIVFVDDKPGRNKENGVFSLPMTGRMHQDWIEVFRIHGLKYGWVNCFSVPTNVIRKVPKIVALDENAAQWVRQHVGRTDVIRVPGFRDWREAKGIEKQTVIAELQLTMEVFSR